MTGSSFTKRLQPACNHLSDPVAQHQVDFPHTVYATCIIYVGSLHGLFSIVNLVVVRRTLGWQVS